MKRLHPPSSSEDSDNGSNSTCWSERSKTQTRRGKGKKPSEVFRTDLITAMKVHDSYQLSQDDYYVLADPWRQEWEKGVQVPVSPQSIPQPVARVMLEKGKEIMFTKPKKLIRTSGSEALGYVDIRTLAEGMCRYDLNEQDMSWLELINEEFTELGLPSLDEITMEMVMEEFERRCHDGISHAVETEEGLGIEYDEDVVCDVCQSPDGEDNNEMVFCDKCNICVHQACYGIQKVPEGSWLCRICALGILPTCQLCPKKGGAMKPTRSGTKWVHVSCALWIPEVSIRNPEKMEPITNVSQIPSNRWSLICCLCKEKSGACIQCSAKNCRTAFHVTCGLHCGLEMNTVLTVADEVKFKSYCPKHSGLEGDESRNDPTGAEEQKQERDHGPRDKKGKHRGRVREPACKSSSVTTPARASSQPVLSSRQQQEKRVNQRKLKLQALEEDFYQFVDADEVASHLKLSRDMVDFVYQYWKVKRKANFNQPLLTPKKDEEESLARREQEVLLRRLELFTHLRQDLERVRNLTYMVTRREKMKRSLCRVQEQTFQQQVRLLDQELLTGNGAASKKPLGEMLSLSLVATQSSQCRPPWGHGGQRAKRGGAGKPRGRRKSSHRNESLSLPESHSEGNGLSSSTTTTPLQEGHKDSISLQKHSAVNVADTVSYTKIHSHGVNVRLHKLEISQLTNHTKLLLPELSKVTNHTKLYKPEVSQVTNHIKLRKPVDNQVNNSAELSKPEVSQVTNHTKLNKTEVNQVTNHTKLNKTEVNQVTNHTKLNKTEVNQVTNHTKLNKTEVNQVTNHTKLNKTEVNQVTNHTKLRKPVVCQVTNHIKLRKPVIQVNNSAELSKPEVSQVTNHTKLNKNEVSQVTNHTKLNKTEVSQVTNHVKHYKEESRRSLKKEASEPNHRDDNSYTMVLTRLRRGNNHHEKEKEEEEEEEKRKRKKKSAAVPRERSPFVSIRRLGSKVIEKQIGWLKGAHVTSTNDGSTDRGPQNSHPQAPVSAPTKPNGCLRRASTSSSSTSNCGTVTNGRSGSHLRSWGKFRIPKRSVGVKDQELSEPSDHTAPLLQQQPPQRCKTPHRQPVTSGPTQPSHPRTRLRTGTESDAEVERSTKRCHSHQLRGKASSISRRYGSHVIRRGVLAS